MSPAVRASGRATKESRVGLGGGGVGIQHRRRRRHHVSCWLARPVAVAVADSQVHASSYPYPDERRVDRQDGRSELSASTHSSVHSERLAPCEGDGHEHRQRSTVTQSVRCPTELPRRQSPVAPRAISGR